MSAKRQYFQVGMCVSARIIGHTADTKYPSTRRLGVINEINVHIANKRGSQSGSHAQNRSYERSSELLCAAYTCIHKDYHCPPEVALKTHMNDILPIIHRPRAFSAGFYCPYAFD